MLFAVSFLMSSCAVFTKQGSNLSFEEASSLIGNVCPPSEASSNIQTANTVLQSRVTGRPTTVQTEAISETDELTEAISAVAGAGVNFFDRRVINRNLRKSKEQLRQWEEQEEWCKIQCHCINDRGNLERVRGFSYSLGWLVDNDCEFRCRREMADVGGNDWEEVPPSEEIVPPTPIVADVPPVPVATPEYVEVDTGISYRVQVLARRSPLPNYSDYFSRTFNLTNVVEGKYEIKGRIMYQYTIGENLTFRDARELKNEIIRKGILDAWIVGYRGEQRVIPSGENVFDKE